MPAGEDQECERFAAVVERGLGAGPPGVGEDDELLRELELVEQLRQSGASLAPSVDESARMRAKVMAAAAAVMQPAAMQPAAQRGELYETAPNADAPTLVGLPLVVDAATRVDVSPVAEHQPTNHQPTNVVSIGRAHRGRHRFPSQSPSRQSRGLLGISAAAAVMVLAVTGGGAMFSQVALPGDTLYGIKQTTESALVGLTPGQGNKAQRQLDYASTRLDEAQKVNTASTPDAEKAADVSQALKGFDDQTKSGSEMWLASANSGSKSKNSQQLSKLSGWAQQQHDRLSTMRASMPAGAQPDADHSMRLLEDVRTRSQSLNNRQGCDHVTSGTDELGPVPAKGPCKAVKASAPPVKSTMPSSVQPRTTPPTEDSSSVSSHTDDNHSDSSDHSDTTSDTPRLTNNPLGNLNGGSDGTLPGSSNQQQPNPVTPPQNVSGDNNGPGLLNGLAKELSGNKQQPSN